MRNWINRFCFHVGKVETTVDILINYVEYEPLRMLLVNHYLVYLTDDTDVVAPDYVKPQHDLESKQ